jgi:hypothetical protein
MTLNQEISMNRRIFLLMTCALVAWGSCLTSRADELSVTIAKDAKFLVRLDVQAFRATALGGKLVEIARKKARQELRQPDGDNDGEDLEKLIKTIGFDPLEEVETILVSGSQFDRPEKSVVVSVRLGKTTGNLEGLILGLPGYTAQQYGKHTIHSATPENDLNVFGAIHTDGKGAKTVLLATDREAVTRQLDALDGKSAADGSFKTIKLATDGKPILAVEVFDIPTELIGEGPQSGVAKILRAISLRISESKENLDIGMRLIAETEQQAEQLRQMVQGLIAFIGFAQSQDPKDKDLEKVRKLAEGLTAARDGSSMKISLSVPFEELTKLIDTID